MKQKPIDDHYDPKGKLRLLGALVQALIIVMIIGISIIVVIIVKEFFFDEKKAKSITILPESINIPRGAKVESVYSQKNRLYMLITSENKIQEILIIGLEDGVEISRDSVKLIGIN